MVFFSVRKVGKDEVIFEKSGNDGHKNRHRTTAILYREPDMETRSRGMELTGVNRSAATAARVLSPAEIRQRKGRGTYNA